ncbi:TPA: hypothetical protein U5D43_002140 [Yersinia enterocolitica]|jgi:hypothetical protein|uniref:SLOG domain-containing protein n=1 Tax=Enterobacterales TaxID=91347 RepID=UPI0005E037CB|nr:MULTISPECIES: hypothetical protein [Enterobacterales]EKN6047578.1 hypothetical protein [Yersinia enterocolitica]MCI4235332.1 hypothetical protein [Dickeya dianthicola]CQJ38340.1 Uncharacterised protein [Yersinia enterocolitica]HEI6973761.1 hypothetical protein [Yersinia enterocolitica]HEN3245233.1 hypothetical protein [Yersinia enterocolitica]
MIEIFLSASVPLPNRDRVFFDTADVLAIREAIKALVEVVLPIGRITCGGHPAITPLLALFSREANLDSNRLAIYQSKLFEAGLPPELAKFADVQMVPSVDNNKEASLTAMRREMIESRSFAAAVIIGGMEGIYEEYKLFVECHPNAIVLPLATTGAAARVIYQQGHYDPMFERDRTYSSLFRRKLLSVN